MLYIISSKNKIVCLVWSYHNRKTKLFMTYTLWNKLSKFRILINFFQGCVPSLAAREKNNILCIEVYSIYILKPLIFKGTPLIFFCFASAHCRGSSSRSQQCGYKMSSSEPSTQVNIAGLKAFNKTTLWGRKCIGHVCLSLRTHSQCDLVRNTDRRQKLWLFTMKTPPGI